MTKGQTRRSIPMPTSDTYNLSIRNFILIVINFNSQSAFSIKFHITLTIHKLTSIHNNRVPDFNIHVAHLIDIQFKNFTLLLASRSLQELHS